MTNHRPFKELRSTFSAERQARNNAATQAMLHEMALNELRQAREKSQEERAISPPYFFPPKQ